MIQTKVNSFLTKLEAEKMPPIKSLSINYFNDKDYLMIDSENYKKLIFYIYWLLRHHFKYISNNKTRAKLWLCYEYEKPYLWSVIDESFIKDLLYLIMVPLGKDKIEDFLLKLYNEMGQRLKLDLEFERLSFNWMLNDDIYIELTTGTKQECYELHSIFEVIKPTKKYKRNMDPIKVVDSLVVLDQNHKTLTIKEQISNILNKLRNIN